MYRRQDFRFSPETTDTPGRGKRLSKVGCKIFKVEMLTILIS